MSVREVFASLPDRWLKRSPWRYHHDRNRWERRTYPCSRWFCFRRSPAWRSFERDGKSWCDRHAPARLHEAAGRAKTRGAA